MTIDKRRYEIAPRSLELGAGWNLTLIQDDEEAGGGVFPIEDEDPQVGIDWWNGMTEGQRAHWLMMAASAIPAAARHAYLLAEAYADALQEGEIWLGVNDH